MLAMEDFLVPRSYDAALEHLTALRREATLLLDQGSSRRAAYERKFERKIRNVARLPGSQTGACQSQTEETHHVETGRQQGHRRPLV